MIKAILFDLDGVIVDSLYFHYLAWEKMFNDRGGSISLRSVYLHEGRNSFEILPLFCKEAGVEIPEAEHADFIEAKRSYYREIAQLKYYPDAFETIEELKKRGFKLALVTASARKNMDKSVNPERQKLFDVIVTGTDIPRAKPNPDPYLTAQKMLGVSVDKCVVIENAPLGIESAKNAGMVCIAVESTLGREYLQQADFIINEIRELTGFFPVLRR
jgi:beta-phosphoglucomutase